MAIRAPSRRFTLEIRPPPGLDEYNLVGEPFETERKRTKAKESKFAFFYFLLVFGIGTFQWVTAEKSEKISPLLRFASGLHFPIPGRCFSPHLIASALNSTLRQRYHRFLFFTSNSWSLLALAVQIERLAPDRRGLIRADYGTSAIATQWQRCARSGPCPAERRTDRIDLFADVAVGSKIKNSDEVILRQKSATFERAYRSKRRPSRRHHEELAKAKIWRVEYPVWVGGYVVPEPHVRSEGVKLCR